MIPVIFILIDIYNSDINVDLVNLGRKDLSFDLIIPQEMIDNIDHAGIQDSDHNNCCVIFKNSELMSDDDMHAILQKYKSYTYTRHLHSPASHGLQHSYYFYDKDNNRLFSIMTINDDDDYVHIDTDRHSDIVYSLNTAS